MDTMTSESAPSKPLWRDRAKPGTVRAARWGWGLLLVLFGAVVEILIAAWLTSRDLGTAALIAWLGYLAVGAIILVVRRGDPPSEERRKSWTVDVFASTVRGRTGQRPLALQLLIWLTIGHAMASAILIVGLLEAAGSLLG